MLTTLIFDDEIWAQEFVMGLFTTLAEMVVTGFGNPDSTQAKLANAVVKKFQTNEGGGLTAILQQLEAKGLGQAVQSWVGTGANQVVSGEQLEKALGSEQIQQLAAHVGVSPDVLRSHLSEILPKIVDRLTPDGKLPVPAGEA
ncbi:MAG TPA: YidB family protein [Planctomycetaceae bacterium]|jgi:uncharacterized protein YidB (DUF937 family)|nr:YidB family protein [Planctomycetaceae bacterium]